MKVAPGIQYCELKNKIIVKFVQSLSQLCCVTLPNLFKYNGLAVLYIVYSGLFCIGLFSLCILTIYFKFNGIYSHSTVTVSILDGLSVFGSTIANIISILSAIFFSRRNLVQLVRRLQEMEKILNGKFTMVCQLDEKALFFQFLALTLLILVFIIYDSRNQFNSGGFGCYKTAVLMHINIFILCMVVMQIQLYSTCIKQYFKFANDRLSTTMQYSLNTPKSIVLVHGTINMRFFLKMYDKICDIIELVNRSFGVQVVFICLLIITCLIKSLNLLMKFALKMDAFGTSWDIPMLISDIYFSFVYIVLKQKNSLLTFNKKKIYFYSNMIIIANGIKVKELLSRLSFLICLN